MMGIGSQPSLDLAIRSAGEKAWGGKQPLDRVSAHLREWKVPRVEIKVNLILWRGAFFYPGSGLSVFIGIHGRAREGGGDCSPSAGIPTKVRLPGKTLLPGKRYCR